MSIIVEFALIVTPSSSASLHDQPTHLHSELDLVLTRATSSPAMSTPPSRLKLSFDNLINLLVVNRLPQLVSEAVHATIVPPCHHLPAIAIVGPTSPASPAPSATSVTQIVVTTRAPALYRPPCPSLPSRHAAPESPSPLAALATEATVAKSGSHASLPPLLSFPAPRRTQNPPTHTTTSPTTPTLTAMKSRLPPLPPRHPTCAPSLHLFSKIAIAISLCISCPTFII